MIFGVGIGAFFNKLVVDYKSHLVFTTWLAFFGGGSHSWNMHAHRWQMKDHKSCVIKTAMCNDCTKTVQTNYIPRSNGVFSSIYAISIPLSILSTSCIFSSSILYNRIQASLVCLLIIFLWYFMHNRAHFLTFHPTARSDCILQMQCWHRLSQSIFWTSSKKKTDRRTATKGTVHKELNYDF